MKLADAALGEIDVGVVLAALDCAVAEVVLETTRDAEIRGRRISGQLRERAVKSCDRRDARSRC